MARETRDMIIKYSPGFLRTLKKAQVMIRKNLKIRIKQFTDNPNDPQLNTHPLKEEYQGYHSIDVTADWRAIYKEIAQQEGELVAYFVAIGTHEQLYKSH